MKRKQSEWNIKSKVAKNGKKLLSEKIGIPHAKNSHLLAKIDGLKSVLIENVLIIFNQNRKKVELLSLFDAL